jgi:hypothetical protein
VVAAGISGTLRDRIATLVNSEDGEESTAEDIRLTEMGGESRSRTQLDLNIHQRDIPQEGVAMR